MRMSEGERWVMCLFQTFGGHVYPFLECRIYSLNPEVFPRYKPKTESYGRRTVELRVSVFPGLISDMRSEHEHDS